MKLRIFITGFLLCLLFTVQSCTEVESLADEELINNTQGIEDGEITDDDI